MGKPWEGEIKYFKLFENLYFIGGDRASMHIWDTGDGLVLFDTGYYQNLSEYLAAFEKMSLDIKKLKFIMLTHGHIDHIGCAKYFREQSGAKIVIGAKDREYVNGNKDLTYSAEFGMKFTETFEPDILLNDGEGVETSKGKIIARAIPGHTEGAVCYFFDVEREGVKYTAAIHGGMGLNTMAKSFLEKYNLSLDLPFKYIETSQIIKKIPVDIHLGNHTFQNRTFEKYEQLKNGNDDAFIVPGEWEKVIDNSVESVKDLLRKEGRL